MRKLYIVIFFNTIVLSSCNSSQINPPKMPANFDKQGHRGCRGLVPENTIAAMLKAVDLGVTTLEMDVCFTKDGEAILSHEPYFSHQITTLPGGSFIAASEEKKYNIYNMTYAETLQYDVGRKPNPGFPRQLKIPATKPRLKDVIDSVEQHLLKNNFAPVHYNIETKTNPSTDNIFHPAPTEFVGKLMNIIRDKGIEERAVIQSFDARTLKILHADFPAMSTAILVNEFDRRTPKQMIEMLGFTPTIFSPAWKLVNAELVSQCHLQNMKIIPWTVNDKEKIMELKNMGVDGIISDYPNLFND